jgi:hypothetical protein
MSVCVGVLDGQLASACLVGQHLFFFSLFICALQVFVGSKSNTNLFHFNKVM